jgi:hypothetical protein
MNTIANTVTALLKAAAAHTGIEARKIYSFQSLYAADRPIMTARWAVMLVLHEDLGMTPTQIANAFGSSGDPARHAIRRAKARTDDEFLALLSHLRAALKSAAA